MERISEDGSIKECASLMWKVEGLEAGLASGGRTESKRRVMRGHCS